MCWTLIDFNLRPTEQIIINENPDLFRYVHRCPVMKNVPYKVLSVNVNDSRRCLQSDRSLFERWLFSIIVHYFHFIIFKCEFIDVHSGFFLWLNHSRSAERVKIREVITFWYQNNGLVRITANWQFACKLWSACALLTLIPRDSNGI